MIRIYPISPIIYTHIGLFLSFVFFYEFKDDKLELIIFFFDMAIVVRLLTVGPSLRLMFLLGYHSKARNKATQTAKIV